MNIAKRITTIEKNPQTSRVFDFQPMAEKAMSMLKISLDALVSEDADLARQIFLMDEEVDSARNMAYKTVVNELNANGGNAVTLINYYLISRHLERIGDRANNIAEEVIYLVEGEIVRGGGDEFN